MKAQVRKRMQEADQIRDMVPSRAYGSKDTVYSAYLDTLNPRENEDVQLALAASGDIRFQTFLDRIQNPRYKKVNMASIAKACDIDLREFNQWWNKGATQAAIARAQLGSVKVTADMVEDAKSITTVCERCDGMTWVGAPAGLPLETPGYRRMSADGKEEVWIRDCPACTQGKVRRPGDSHARDKVLEIAGLTRKGGGVNVSISNYGGASHASAVQSLEDVMTIDVGSDA
jgi:hypothetical protein